MAKKSFSGNRYTNEMNFEGGKELQGGNQTDYVRKIKYTSDLSVDMRKHKRKLDFGRNSGRKMRSITFQLHKKGVVFFDGDALEKVAEFN